jgi:thiol-disulfide isomerase/thioredoxin
VGWESTQGRVVVIAFFASWCGPCRLELPELARLARSMSSDPVTFAAVSVDERSRDYTRVLSEIDLEGLYVGWDPALGTAWRVQALPTTWIVDKKGVARHLHQGYAPGGEKEVEEQVRALLREP